MRGVIHSLAFATLTLVGGCGNGAEYQKRKATLDSISGAVNSLASQLRNIDTAALDEQVETFEHYRAFISRSLPDTIGRNMADQLHHFFEAGDKMRAFRTNRRLLLSRASLSISQYQRLGADLIENNIPLEQLDLHLTDEVAQASQLVRSGQDHLRGYFSNTQEFRLLRKQVEQIIRHYNNGQLPTIISDSTGT